MIIPRNISFDLWASQLNIDYSKDNVPIHSGEDNWKAWASSLVQSDSFVKAGAPAPGDEKDWKEWASKIYQLMQQ